MQQVRSVVVFPSAVDIMPALESFKVLRVLHLEGCDLSQGFSLKYIGSLFHLRYLGLRSTRTAQLPEELTNLLFLQTLDVSCNIISTFPSTVVQLRNLMCLHIDDDTRVPNGIIGSLTSLEELSTLCIDNSTGIVEELGHLTELRVLEIVCHIEWNDALEKSLVACLCKMQKIQSLSIWVSAGEFNLDGWAPPRHLRRLQLMGCCFSTLTDWMSPSLLVVLSSLYIGVSKLRQEDLEILGRLPSLCYLNLEVDHQNLGILGRFFVGACSFPCLVECVLQGFGGPVVFQQGAMPRLAILRFTFPVREAREFTSSNGGFDLGLGNLSCLQNVTVYLQSEGASKEEVEEAKAALRRRAEIHLNRPTLEIVDNRFGED
uniref:Disease resistance R13L4/SHOC-2-like LRR domain-containing protein n=1 Tax=Arundo donax TaxID=35708 RepID=A0A0A9GHU1_ARUDO